MVSGVRGCACNGAFAGAHHALLLCNRDRAVGRGKALIARTVGSDDVRQGGAEVSRIPNAVPTQGFSPVNLDLCVLHGLRQRQLLREYRIDVGRVQGRVLQSALALCARRVRKGRISRLSTYPLAVVAFEFPIDDAMRLAFGCGFALRRTPIR